MSDDIAPLKPFVDPDRLKADVGIDITNITQGMIDQAGLYVHYATQTVRAKRQYERQKRLLEILEARLNSDYRRELVSTDEKGKVVKPTEPQVTAAVHNDKRYQTMSSRVIDAQEIWRLAEVAERSFEHRKDMLLQIARDAAREAQGGTLRVAANQANSQRREDLLKSLAATKKPSEETPPWEDGATA